MKELFLALFNEQCAKTMERGGVWKDNHQSHLDLYDRCHCGYAQNMRLSRTRDFAKPLGLADKSGGLVPSLAVKGLAIPKSP